MHLNYLDFEQPIADLEAKIQELRMVTNNTDINISDEVSRLEAKSRQLTRDIFSRLTPWQVTQLARHPLRPHTMDYITQIFTEFDELHGDRMFSKGPSIVAGLARFNNQPVMVLGHEKGRKTQEKIERNFGMPNPEDYRKALRLMKMAEKFKLPLFTFIDTFGAYPGIGAEQRNQSEAIARNLLVLSRLRTPIICTVIGEGGSGGALAIGIGDRVLMLQYSIYCVITPEGCASILWKNSDKASQAAEAMGVSAEQNLHLKLIDQVIPEPLGGAHRNYDEMATTLKEVLAQQLAELQGYSTTNLIEARYKRLMMYGVS
jgi:acetyl-CoA carboxylase carboxyl transferase subunit alpha